MADMSILPNELGITIGVGAVMGVGVEYTAGEGIWIEDHVINADVTQEEVDGKADATHTHAIADVDGLQAALDGIASAADALMGDPSESTWATRTSTGSGMARVESVQGASVAWNQLNTNAGSTTTINGVTFTNNGDGSWTVSGTANADSTFVRANGNTPIVLVPSHVYLITGCPEVASSSTCNLNFGGTGYAYADGAIWTNPQHTNAHLRIQVNSGVTLNNEVFWPQIFDLTAMFGAGNEPATVAEFEAMFPEPCYPYSAPTLKPVTIAGIASTDAQGGELDSVEWTAQTLRAAGSVRDELTADELVTRVGVVDLGTLTWIKGKALNDGTGVVFYTYEPTSTPIDGSVQCECATLRCVPYSTPWELITFGDVFTKGSGIVVGGAADISVAEFKAAMQGVMLYYGLATPTTTPISPALPMSYKVEQGGTESIIVPSGEVSAAPVLTVAEGESAADVVMGALAAIAAPDGPTATANHAVGTYLTMQGKLYKVTSAIAVGESIVAGTNVTETTVMDDTRMVVLEYGVSTWADFQAAYEANRVVYCRVPNADGARMAFLAYVPRFGSGSAVEFQYYRSVANHSYAAQGDEIYIYQLSPNNTWTTTVRKAYTRIVAGDGLKSTYANGVLTISLDQ